MTDTEQLQMLLDQAETDDLYEEAVEEFILERGIKYLSHSRKYLINLAFNLVFWNWEFFGQIENIKIE